MDRLGFGATALSLGIALMCYNVYCLIEDEWSFMYSSVQFLTLGLITLLIITGRWLELRNIESRLNDQEYLMKLVTEWITTEEE